jgi:hypothetical protein
MEPTSVPSPSRISNETLIKILAENLSHARHQEVMRERQNNLYWALWAGSLAFVFKGGETGLSTHSGLFVLIAAISFCVLLTSLKWNAEFGNHIAAAAKIGEFLEINKVRLDLKDSDQPWLPYDEFTGVMALPLRFPMQMSVGPWISVLHCIGFGTAIYLAILGFVGDQIVAGISGIIAVIAGVILCKSIFDRMKSGIKSRTPERLNS